MMVNQPLPCPRIAGLMPVLMLFFATEIAPEAPQAVVSTNQGDFETMRRQHGKGVLGVKKSCRLASPLKPAGQSASHAFASDRRQATRDYLVG